MRVNSQNNNTSFGAISIPFLGKPLATEVSKKIMDHFHPKGIISSGRVTMFFQSNEHEEIARKLLKANNITHIHIPDELLKNEADKELFSQIDISC